MASQEIDYMGNISRTACTDEPCNLHLLAEAAIEPAQEGMEGHVEQSSFSQTVTRRGRGPRESTKKGRPAGAAAATAAAPGPAAAGAGAHMGAAEGLERAAAAFHVKEEHFLDDISRWLLKELKAACNTCVPDGATSIFFWVPPHIARAIGRVEPVAFLVVRESLLLLMAAFVIRHTERISRSLRWGVKKVQRQFSGSEGEDNRGFERSVFAAAVAPSQFFILATVLARHTRLVLPLFRVPWVVHKVVANKIRAVALTWAVVWFVLKCKKNALDDFLAASKLTKQNVLEIDRVLSLGLLVLGALTTAEVWGVRLKSLAAFGGISGLAIGLASQEVVTNFFGGLVLFISSPFVVGDFIKTKLLGPDKNPMTVPNRSFTNLAITNMSRAKNRILSASFQLRHQDILVVDPITCKITELLKRHPAVDTKAATPVCYLNSFQDMSLEITLSAHAKMIPFGEWLAAQQQILVEAANIIIGEGAFIGRTAPFAPVEVSLPAPQGDAGLLEGAAPASSSNTILDLGAGIVTAGSGV
eukprot:jgi/Mesen1/9169/ME000591S08485